MHNDKIKNSEKVKPIKFNASLSFSHRPPYDDLFSERIPLLQAFQIALINHQSKIHRMNYFDKFISLFNRGSQCFRGAECGVYTGNSLLACASLAKESGLYFQLTGLDTFSGLPALSEIDQSFAPANAAYRTKTLFADTSIESVYGKVVSAGFSKNIKLIPGLFSSTLPKLRADSYHFINIDCDLYEPHIECLEYFYPKVVSGGVVFFDDYHSIDFPMARKAIDAFMADKPEKLFHLRYGDDAANRTKCFFIKF